MKPSENKNDDLNDEPFRIKVHPRSRYNYDTKKVSDETGLSCPEPTLTQQHQAEETDINYIVQRFGVTGLLPQRLDLPTYGDFTGVFDYQSAMNLIIQADKEFQSLPADCRSYFMNDPAKFLHYMENNPDPEVLERFGLAHITRPIPPPLTDADMPAQ